MKTTRAILKELHEKLVTEYKNQLDTLPMKKATKECLLDGFRDGIRSAIHHTIAMLGVEVVEEEEKS